MRVDFRGERGRTFSCSESDGRHRPRVTVTQLRAKRLAQNRTVARPDAEPPSCSCVRSDRRTRGETRASWPRVGPVPRPRWREFAGLALKPGRGEVVRITARAERRSGGVRTTCNVAAAGQGGRAPPPRQPPASGHMFASGGSAREVARALRQPPARGGHGQPPHAATDQAAPGCALRRGPPRTPPGLAGRQSRWGPSGTAPPPSSRPTRAS